MSQLPSTTLWLLGGVATMLGAQLVIVLVWAIHNAWADRRLRRLRTNSRVFADLFETLEAEESTHVRHELADRQLGRDVRRLETWLDLVATRGHDPASLEATVFEESGVVDRNLHRLRHHRSWTRRAAAAALLGWTGSPRAVPALLDCARDIRGETVGVRSVALRALARIRHPEAAEPLLDSLDSEETWLPPVVASILARIGEPALLALIRKVGDETGSAQGRRWAAQILGDIGHRRSLQVLHRSLTDMDPELRARAARALGSIADERSVTPLLDRLLVDPIPFVRTSVAKALGQISTDRTVHFLVEALGDPEWWVRLRAVEALEQIGEPARDLLLTTLHDRNVQVAHEAARALEGQGVVAEALERVRSEGYVPEVSEFLIDLGKAGNVDPLLDELESRDADTVRVVVRILARIGDRRAGPELVALLDREDMPEGLKARAVDALRRVGAAEYVERVLPILEDENEWVRKTAVDYIGAFGGRTVIDRILPRVEDDNPWARESALRVLERLRLDPPAPASVARCLRDEHLFVRAQAVRTVCAARDFQALVDSEIPESMAEPELREALLDGMRESATPEALPLLSFLVAFASTNDLDRLTEILTTAFQDAEPAEVTREIESRLGPGVESSGRWIAASLLALTTSDQREPWLATFLADQDPRVRAAAIVACGRARVSQTLLLKVITRALADEAPHVVRAGLRAAASDPRPVLKTALESVLRHPDVEVRVDTALALAFYPSTGRDRMRSLALDRSPEARLASTMARLYRDEEGSVAAWLEILQDEDQRRRIEAWVEGDNPIARALLLDDGVGRHGLSRRLLGCRSPFEAERLLLEELDANPDEHVRRQSLDGLTKLGTERAAGRILSAFLKDHSPNVRAGALEYLVRNDVFGRRQHFLETGLRDPSELIQIPAAHLTVLLPAENAIRLLVEQLGSRRPVVLQTVSDILAGFFTDDPDQVMDVFLGLDASVEELLGLITTLEKTAAEISTELLEVLLDHRWARVRARALGALLPRLGERTWTVLRRAVADPAPTVRHQAVQCLAHARYRALFEERPEAIAQVLDQARRDPSPNVRARAALALASFAPTSARTWLRELRHDNHSRVSRAAQRALRRLDAPPVQEVKS